MVSHKWSVYNYDDQRVIASHDSHSCLRNIQLHIFTERADIWIVFKRLNIRSCSKEAPCRFNASTVGATCRKSIYLKPTEDVLKWAVATVGPISVAIDANNTSFRHYHSGVYNDANCTSDINHAVLVVGYGHSTSDYWLVKNRSGVMEIDFNN